MSSRRFLNTVLRYYRQVLKLHQEEKGYLIGGFIAIISSFLIGSQFSDPVFFVYLTVLPFFLVSQLIVSIVGKTLMDYPFFGMVSIFGGMIIGDRLSLGIFCFFPILALYILSQLLAYKYGPE